MGCNECLTLAMLRIIIVQDEHGEHVSFPSRYPAPHKITLNMHLVIADVQAV